MECKEEKIASRLRQRHNLPMPFDLESFVLEKYADIEEEEIPSGADGLLLKRSKRTERPLILLNKSIPESRKRFTLAHELGHLVIPWHNGFSVCFIDKDYGEFLYHIEEEEANRFAAELLMPTEWLSNLISGPNNLESILETVYRTALVSKTAACLKIIKSAPRGFGYIETNESDEVKYVAKSAGTMVRLPNRGHFFDPEAISKMCDDCCRVSTPYSTIFLLKLATIEYSPTSDQRSSKDIIKDILTDLGYDKAKSDTLLRSINGIIGAANANVERDSSALYNAFIQRFQGREELSQVVKHKDFITFINKKAGELAA